MTKLNIFIRLYIKSTISLEVEPSDDIESIKSRIEYLEELPKIYQRFIFNGIELEDSKNIRFYNVKNHSTIICETSVLLVTTPKEDILSFNISRFDTAGTIKEMIEESTKISKDDQLLFYACCSFRGKQLDDSKTIDQNEINGHLVHMQQVFPGMQVFVEVLTNTRSILNIKCKKSDTINKIKAEIEKQTGLSKDEQIILYLHNELEDETLAYYNIQNKAVLQMTMGKIIFIKRLCGINFSLNVEKFYTIENIKLKIEEKQGISKNLQKLYFHGQSLEDSKTLASYQINFGMKMELHIGLHIKIISQLKRKLILDILLNSKILDIKTEIKKRLGFPINYQNLKYNGIDLDDEKTLQHYNVKDYSYINLNVRARENLQLTFIKDNIKEYCEANFSDKILDLKNRAANIMKCSLNEYYLSYRGNYLQEDKSVLFYGIENYSTLLLVRKKNNLMTLFIKTLFGKTITLPSIAQTETIEDLKIYLQKVHTTPVDDIRLIFCGKQLEDSKTLAEYGIKHKSALMLVERLRGC